MVDVIEERCIFSPSQNAQQNEESSQYNCVLSAASEHG